MSGKIMLRGVWILCCIGLVFSCSSPTDCPSICTPLAQQCTEQGILVCAQSLNTGCYNWAILPCPKGTTCKQVNNLFMCDGGEAQCSNTKHAKACVGQVIYWFDNCGKQQEIVMTCPAGTTCQEAQCKTTGSNNCPTPCSVSAKRCKAGNGIEECVLDNQGCTVWRDAQPCPQGQVCRNGGCYDPNSNNNQNNNQSGCTNDCQAGQVQCLGNAYQNCTQGSDSCYRWGQALACPQNQLCQNGKCQPTSGPCQDQCTRGHQRCIGQQFQICEQIGDCNQWGSPQNCGSGQTCKLLAPTIECTCLPGYLPHPSGTSCYPNSNQNNNNQNNNQNNQNNNQNNQNNNQNNNGNPSDCTMNPLEKQVWDIVNQERQTNGKSALGCHSKLVEAARKWSTEQCRMGSLSHADLSTRVGATGLSVSGYGENVAYGSSTATGVMNMWMNSSGHRANILSSTYSHIGVGLDTCNNRHFWTQIFVKMR